VWGRGPLIVQRSERQRPVGPETHGFGFLLRQYRLEAGLTQEALAERADLGASTIQQLEGDDTRPHRETVQRLAAALALSPEQQARFEFAAPSGPPEISGGAVTSRHLPGLPEGTVSFLHTDIEGASRLFRSLGAGYPAILEKHRLLLREAFESCGGVVVSADGDTCLAAFASPTGALAGALAGQQALAAHDWPDGDLVRVRMGVQTGEAVPVAGRYVAIAVHQAVGTSNAGHGGQVLLTDAVASVVRDQLPEGVALQDLGIYRLKQFDRPVRLYQAQEADHVQSFPALRSPSWSSHNLPTPPSSFIGRAVELVEAGALLRDCRMLTIVGTGGVGKTRFAVELARTVADDHPDGVWLAELASIEAGASVANAVAQALGLRVMPLQSPTEAVINRLNDGRPMLVLDNCEHVLAAVAKFAAAILKSCPGTAVLATSREPLRISGESVFRLPPMPVPGARDSLSPEALLGFDAARLFVERAARPPVLSQDTCAEIAELCIRLDGLPLAIELAAARLSHLTPLQITARLVDRFQLLTLGRRDDMARHQTLRALIDWSYDLLSEPEQRFFRLVSTFGGGFTLDAAEKAFGDISGVAVVDLVAALVEKSLLVVDHTGAWARYRLLDTIREYALQQRDEAGEAHEARKHHAAWALGFGELASTSIAGPHMRAWLDRLDAERDNMRTALECFAHSGDHKELLRLAVALAPLWWIRGPVTDGRRWLDLALEGAAEASPLVVLALTENAALSFGGGDGESARKLAGEALHMAQDLGKEELASGALNVMTVAVGWHDDAQAAHEFSARAAQLARQAGNAADLVWALVHRVTWKGTDGRYEGMRRDFDEALAVAQASGNPRLRQIAVGTLGELATDEGRYDEACRLQEEARTLALEHGDGREVAWTCWQLGIAAFRAADLRRAEAAFEDGLLAARERGDDELTAFNLYSYAELAIAQRRLDFAESRGHEALRLALRVGSNSGVWYTLDVLARVAVAHREHPKAARLMGAADAIRKRMRSVYVSFRGDETNHRAAVTRARQEMGEPAFMEAWKDGQTMTLGEVATYALEPIRDPAVVKAPAVVAPPRATVAELAPLTRREAQVAVLVSQGLTSLRIAAQLHLAERTVENHVQNALNRLALNSRAQLAAWVARREEFEYSPGGKLSTSADDGAIGGR
jgi:predicted ATPase/DNA-binding CsgD family transcriptional regulator/transcriptional regulator with XRE-family HTH domain